MAKRTFQQYSIAAGGTPQPLIGTTLSAAVAPGGTDPNGDPAPQTIAVASSAMFRNGDWAVIGTVAGGDAERVWIQSVPDSTHIKTRISKSHANGVYVRLAMACQSVYIQTKQGNAGAIYVGTEGMVKATPSGVITILYPFAAPTQPIDWSDPVEIGADGTTTADFWVDGTTGDGYMPSLTIL
jgi:hypothetical protein